MRRGSRGQQAAEITAVPTVKLLFELYLEKSKAGYDMIKDKERVGESNLSEKNSLNLTWNTPAEWLYNYHQTHLQYSAGSHLIPSSLGTSKHMQLLFSPGKCSLNSLSIKKGFRVFSYPDSPHCCHDLHPAVGPGHVQGPHILEQRCKMMRQGAKQTGGPAQYLYQHPNPKNQPNYCRIIAVSYHHIKSVKVNRCSRTYISVWDLNKTLNEYCGVNVAFPPKLNVACCCINAATWIKRARLRGWFKLWDDPQLEGLWRTCRSRLRAQR